MHNKNRLRYLFQLLSSETQTWPWCWRPVAWVSQAKFSQKTGNAHTSPTVSFHQVGLPTTMYNNIVIKNALLPKIQEGHTLKLRDGPSSKRTGSNFLLF